MASKSATIGEYLLLRFYHLIEHSPIRHIGMTREDAAGYTADAYARVNGMGLPASPTAWAACR